MQSRTFFFIIFILSSSLFFLCTYNPYLALNICGSLCKESDLSLNYIQLTSMITSALALIIVVISNYYLQKRILLEKERMATDRLNIDEIHAELEALQHS